MTRPRTYKTEALVLKSQPLGEADRLLTLYTPGRGKIKAVAKGVRKSTSKLGGHLEPLVCSALMLAQGRNLDVVAQAENKESFMGLRDHLEAVAEGMYMAELVDSLTPEEAPAPGLYRLLYSHLAWLEKAVHAGDKGAAYLLLRHFELHLLAQLGYMPELYRCVACKATILPEPCFFSPQGGGTVCSSCRSATPGEMYPLSLEALKVLRYLLNVVDPQARSLRVSTGLRGELERVLRSYVRYLLEREAASILFLNHLERQAPGLPARS